MPSLVIDAMDDATRWQALAPDGITPSGALSLANDSAQVRFGADGRSGRIEATASALDHTLRRAVGTLNLADFDELRLWLWSSRAADGSAAAPFFLELRLGSAGLAPDSPGNTWHRALPVAQAETWQLARLDLRDLPAAVREAVTSVQVRCTSATPPFTCHLDDVLAVREEMIGDVDAALFDRLHQRLRFGANAVPAVLNLPENPPPANAPIFQITNLDIRLARERMTPARARSDFSGNGYRLRPSAVPYDLYYEIDALADTRPHQSRMLEFVLQTLAPKSELIVNGVALAVDWVDTGDLAQTDRPRADRALLHFRVQTRLEAGAAEPVTPPYRQIAVAVEPRGP